MRRLAESIFARLSSEIVLVGLAAALLFAFFGIRTADAQTMSCRGTTAGSFTFGTCYGTDGAVWSCTIMSFAAGSEASCRQVQPGYTQLTTNPLLVPCAYLDAFRQQLDVALDVHRVAGCEHYSDHIAASSSKPAPGTGTDVEPPAWIPGSRGSFCFPC